MIFICLTSCRKQAATTAKELSLADMQSQIGSLIDGRQYDEARILLNRLDLDSYVVDAQSAGEEGGPQFWGVFEDGLDLPYIQETERSRVVDSFAELEDNAWVLPGTSDAQQPGAESRWQDAAKDVAARFNEKLYTAMQHDKS